MRDLSIGRWLSLIIAAIYLVITSIGENSPAEVLANLLIMSGALLLPMACIWFGDELGDYVGALPGPSITHRSPGWMVRLGGWILLLLPVIIMLFVYRF